MYAVVLKSCIKVNCTRVRRNDVATIYTAGFKKKLKKYALLIEGVCEIC